MRQDRSFDASTTIILLSKPCHCEPTLSQKMKADHYPSRILASFTSKSLLNSAFLLLLILLHSGHFDTSRYAGHSVSTSSFTLPTPCTSYSTTGTLSSYTL